MSDSQQTSSAGSMMDSAAGTIREGIANITGNPHDEEAAKEKKGLSSLKEK